MPGKVAATGHLAAWIMTFSILPGRFDMPNRVRRVFYTPSTPHSKIYDFYLLAKHNPMGLGSLEFDFETVPPNPTGNWRNQCKPHAAVER